MAGIAAFGFEAHECWWLAVYQDEYGSWTVSTVDEVTGTHKIEWPSDNYPETVAKFIYEQLICAYPRVRVIVVEDEDYARVFCPDLKYHVQEMMKKDGRSPDTLKTVFLAPQDFELLGCFELLRITS